MILQVSNDMRVSWFFLRSKLTLSLKKKLLLIITHPQVIQDVYVILFSVKKKLRFLMKTFQDFSAYNGLQWEPNGTKDSFSANCKLFKGL